MPTPAPVTQVTVNRDDPWKDDGNIVLTAGGNYFRVHRSVLSAHSQVFKDMFDCPHSSDVEKDFIELCPVVHLYDAARDVQIMLKAMYDRSYPKLYYEKMPISVVSAFLHLGEKYAIPAFVKEAKAKLCCDTEPTSITSAAFATPPLASKLFPGICDGDPHNFQVLNLLQEMGMKAPLPLAMYQCFATCPLEIIADGYQFMGSTCSLSSANLRSSIRMKDVLENYRVRLAKTLSRSPNCMVPGCTHNIHRLWSEEINVVPPFCYWRSQWDNLFCKSCISGLKTRRDAEMDRAWNQIPPAFGFGSWAEVKKSGDFPSLKIRLG
ncbi:hypothetical protein EV363DRAFT_185555 [Boletus edulis]|nr:hypothetical protein EV363DRAFT_185555 [Boletus edulis]